MDVKDKEYYEKKRNEVIERLKPIGDQIGIKVDYVIDFENNREYLTCNGQNICTNSTSLYGIENEFWGYVFLNKYERYHSFRKHQENVIKRYWYDDNFNQPWCKWN
ncbi:hypothetical protein AOC36_09660 [Erysipelothrix larvae]|uniref:Uncharacterized protein n=1 Tax=Erysipelothrix larvae TaxID=1514105 RepID=A0A0X8H183_9FIRM|nr:hypothetical protein [Erysipelothrix larvae]AMC94239.1 hypothetical protein AOC36_09660 [Erysipelothrix larvae]